MSAGIRIALYLIGLALLLYFFSRSDCPQQRWVHFNHETQDGCR